MGEQPDISIVIRTYNEAQWLPDELRRVSEQDIGNLKFEVVLVDSGSTDNTVAIAKSYNCRIEKIEKAQFTFGRSLNIGCDAAAGKYIVILSGHCLPNNSDWLQQLVRPLIDGSCHYVYGRQVGHPDITRHSEHQIFKKYYPEVSSIPQEGIFANNANSALLKSIWKSFPFDESVTGLEDMLLAKQLVSAGYKVGYVAEATITHIHHESWPRVRNRYEREAIALQLVMPEVHVNFIDFLRYFFAAALIDCGVALEQKKFWRCLPEIFMFRLMQFWGTYRGNNDHRRISKQRKERYFYPV